jgi:hypothetical protein
VADAGDLQQRRLPVAYLAAFAVWKKRCDSSRMR